MAEPMAAATAEDFAGELFGLYTAGVVTLMIDLAHRTGLLEAMGHGPGTSAELADRAGLQERYVRECLSSLATGGIVTYEPATSTFELPPHHAECLTGEGSKNMAPLASIGPLLARHSNEVAAAFREGGGVPYEAFRPEFTDTMDSLSRGLFDEQLTDGILPATGDLPERLKAGIRAYDIGCGTGHSTNVLARAFPASTFVGLDLAADAIERGRAEAAEWGLDNVSFEVLDLVNLAASPPVDAVFAFDVIHDQAHPAEVLERVSKALADDGVFVMMDIRASSHLEKNMDNPFAPLLYGLSTMHCMTVSLARDGAGLGTCWGHELATQMLADAGFVDVTLHEVPDDPLDVLYVARPA